MWWTLAVLQDHTRLLHEGGWEQPIYDNETMAKIVRTANLTTLIGWENREAS
jgi:hypothetical protein